MLALQEASSTSSFIEGKASTSSFADFGLLLQASFGMASSRSLPSSLHVSDTMLDLDNWRGKSLLLFHNIFSIYRSIQDILMMKQ